MVLDLRRLKYVHAIAQNGSLTRAAESLGVAQPALSHHLAELEAHFGSPLFHRIPRGMVPTEVGQILAAHAASILRSVEDAEAAARNSVDSLAGAVTLGLLNTVALRVAVPLFQRCSEHFPNIRLSISEGTSQSLKEGMQRQDLDLAVNLSEAAEGAASPLATEALVLVTWKRPGESDGPIPFSEATARPLIMPGRDHVLRRIVEWAALQSDLKLNIRYELAGGWTLKSAVAAGLGDTIIGRSAVTPEERHALLTVREITSPMLERRLALVVSPMRESAPAVDAVRTLLRELFVELSGDGSWQVAFR